MSERKISLRGVRSLRTTPDTRFHIDHDWWENSGRDFRLYLRDQLCEECRERFADHQNTENVDWVDPDTGEVHQTDDYISVRGETQIAGETKRGQCYTEIRSRP